MSMLMLLAKLVKLAEQQVLWQLAPDAGSASRCVPHTSLRPLAARWLRGSSQSSHPSLQSVTHCAIGLSP